MFKQILMACLNEAVSGASTMARLFHEMLQNYMTFSLWHPLAANSLSVFPKYGGRWTQQTVTAVGQK